MYLSRVEINQYRRETMRALASPQIMHAAVTSSFPSTESAVSERTLWRIDKIGSMMYILVQSSIRPDFTHIIEQFGWPSSGQNWDTIDMDRFLASIEKGQTWRFRIRANPVHSVKNSNDEGRGKVLAHVTLEQQKNWFFSKAYTNGFKIIKSDTSEEEACMDIKETDLMVFKRQNDKVTINAVTFEGILIVEDRERFINALLKGIGRAKTYGCGLLTIARLQ